MTFELILTGALAGVGLGYVFQRVDLCFHSTWRGVFEGQFHLFKVWILGVALAAVGLAALYETDRWSLNEGLAFRPQGNILGGLIIGAGMVVAASCVSGLLYKVGSGMAGAAVGLAAWTLGDVIGRDHLTGRGGSTDLRGQVTQLDEGLLVPDQFGLSRPVGALIFLAVVGVVLARATRHTERGGQWNWWVGGVALGAATVAAWVLAGAGGASFGPSTVGAPASVVSGEAVNQWLVAFLVFMVVGAFVAARTSGSFWLRGEDRARYAQLAAGGLMLGVGGQIGGGCNLGHGLSGAAQMNVSSWVVVASIIVGIYAARAVQRTIVRSPASRKRLANWRLRAA